MAQITRCPDQLPPAAPEAAGIAVHHAQAAASGSHAKLEAGQGGGATDECAARCPDHRDPDQLFLDPNNPRLAREQRPGYTQLDEFLTPQAQAELQRQLRHRYRVTGLVSTIVSMGWLPVDAILVWG